MWPFCHPPLAQSVWSRSRGASRQREVPCVNAEKLSEPYTDSIFLCLHYGMQIAILATILPARPSIVGKFFPTVYNICALPVPWVGLPCDTLSTILSDTPHCKNAGSCSSSPVQIPSAIWAKLFYSSLLPRLFLPLLPIVLLAATVAVKRFHRPRSPICSHLFILFPFLLFSPLFYRFSTSCVGSIFTLTDENLAFWQKLSSRITSKE